MLFPDQRMMGKAKSASPIISQIDYSWQEMLLKAEATSKRGRLPFVPREPVKVLVTEAEMIIVLGPVHIFTDTMVGATTYKMLMPFEFDAKLMAVFHMENGLFRGFTIKPKFGFHFLHGDSLRSVPIICTNELRPPKEYESQKELMEWGNKVVELQRFVNLYSLGSVYLPQKNPYRKYFGSWTNGDRRERNLLDNKLITPLL